MGRHHICLGWSCAVERTRGRSTRRWIGDGRREQRCVSSDCALSCVPCYAALLCPELCCCTVSSVLCCALLCPHIVTALDARGRSTLDPRLSMPPLSLPPTIEIFSHFSPVPCPAVPECIVPSCARVPKCIVPCCAGVSPFKRTRQEFPHGPLADFCA